MDLENSELVTEEISLPVQVESSGVNNLTNSAKPPFVEGGNLSPEGENKATIDSDKIVERIIEFVGTNEIDESVVRNINLLQTVRKCTEKSFEKAEEYTMSKFDGYEKKVNEEYQLLSKNFKGEMIKRMQKLYNSGKVSSFAAKVWLEPEAIGNTPQGVRLYKGLTETYTQAEMDTAAWISRKNKYSLFLVNLAEGFDKNALSFQEALGNEPLQDVKQLYSNDTFLHFNADKPRGDGIDLRVYVSANMLRDPSAMIYAWGEALNESGLKDSLYFKIPTALISKNKQSPQRIDNIVIYKHNGIPDDKFKALLSQFVKKCQALSPDVLADSEHTLPTTIPIARGITIAAEPEYINEYLRYTDNKSNKHSLNTFMDRMFELSIVIAKVRIEKTGRNIASINDYGVKDETKKIFREFLILSKINPDTMLPERYGNSLPEWANL